MGFFDIPVPLLSAADRVMQFVMPIWAIPVVWGVMAASLASWLYLKFSPQDRIEQVKREGEEARAAMLAYDGDFDGVLPLARRTLALSGKRFVLSLGPALVASLPALFLIAHLDSAYGHRQPAPGAAVAVRVVPTRVPVTWLSASAAREADGTWQIRWPTRTAPVQLASADGSALLTLPLRTPVPEVGKFEWWNLLFGNPAGYLPSNAPVESVEAELPTMELVAAGPPWMRGWEALFFAAAALVGVTIKLVFRFD